MTAGRPAPRVLVLGAGGMLARDLVAAAPGDLEVVTRASRELDVTQRDAVADTVADVRPDVVINCAAYTDVDGAESQRDRAFAVNGDAPGIVAAALAGRPGAAWGEPLLIHYGSDYVFDGAGARPYREDDPCAPVGAYGASKLAGERSIAAHGRHWVILRTQWLYGLHGRSFPRTIHGRAVAGQPTKVVNDQTGRPTFTVDLARATWMLVAAERRAADAVPGRILHVANAGIATWYDVARHIFRRAGAEALLSPCSTAEFPRPARRPAWSVLDTARFERLAGGPLPAWEDALDRFLTALEQEGGSGS